MNAPPNPAAHRWLPIVTVLAAVAGVLALQLPWISRPPFDAHCFRQSQTLATIEMYAAEGIDLAHPRTNYVGEPGVFVLEFPLFQALAALLYQWFGAHVWLVRILNLAFTFGSAVAIYAIGRRLFNREAGMAASLVFAFAPLNLVYMASTLIDPSATFFSLITFFFGLRILHRTETEPPPRALDWSVFALACLVTALIKTLYLFPLCVLLTAVFLRERKMSKRLFSAGLCLVFAVGVFGLWLHHSRQVNDASYFTRGVNPTSLLGFEFLLRPAFYKEMARRGFIHLMGPAGSLLAFVAVGAALARVERRERWTVALLITIGLGYLLLFSRANGPHDYYSLVISPYGCLLAGFGAIVLAGRLTRTPASSVGLPWTTAMAVAAVALSLLVFLKRPRLAPDETLRDLQELARGKFEPNSFAMVFVAPDPQRPIPANVGTEMPEALYATGLRGTGRMVIDGQAALAFWKEYKPHYRSLKYAVFYRLDPPPEILQSARRTISSDPGRKWFAFEVD